MMRTGALLLMMAVMTGSAAAETIQLYAAGSLRSALTDIARAYERSTGNRIEAKYGPSGLLKNEISGGAKADVFASWSIRRRSMTKRRAVRLSDLHAIHCAP